MVATLAPGGRLTVDDLASFPDDGRPRELVDGRVVEWDVPNFEHGFFAAVLARVLGNHVLARRLGVVVTTDTMVRILNSEYDARGADVAFFARDRIPTDRRSAATATPPDLVIEILSPSDRAAEVQAKVRDWLRAGVRLLWYIDPDSGVTAVHEGSQLTYVSADEALTGGAVVPGFSVRVRDVLDEMAAITEPDA